MFPTDVDIAGEITPAITQLPTTNDNLGRSLKFDYETNSFVIINGKNVEPSKIDAIKQWIELYIRTEINKYVIYTDEFGVDLNGLVGYRLPRGLQVAEIMRRINNGILSKCPNVTKVSDWNFDKGHFTFTVTTNTGEEVVINE